jgi:hypothetical protein
MFGCLTGLVALVITGLAAPSIVTAPTHQVVPPGGTAIFSVTATSTAGPLSYQWLRNGAPIAGATSSTHVVPAVQPDQAGLYHVQVTDASGLVASAPVVLGLASNTHVFGSGLEVGPNIRHANGNTYDQILLVGPAESLMADPGQIFRTSFLDLDNDIVQVEFSGAGTLTLVLENPSGPAPPPNYNQSTAYMKGHAGIVITGANETTHLSIFSVGSATALNQSLFQPGFAYDGVADIGYVAIVSADGRFGGIRTANVSYSNVRGVTGIYAPGVTFTGPVYLGDIAASNAAAPSLVLGWAGDVRITGGSLAQPNGASLGVGGMGLLQFTNGSDSHGRVVSAQNNRATLVAASGAVLPAVGDNSGSVRTNAFTRMNPTRRPVTVSYVALNGVTVSLTAYPGEIAVHAAAGTTPAQIWSLVRANGGVVIAQSPVIRYYLVQVNFGAESDFITRVTADPAVHAAAPNPAKQIADAVDLRGLADANGNLPTIPLLSDLPRVANNTRLYQLDDFVNAELQCGLPLTHGQAVGYGAARSFMSAGLSINALARYDEFGNLLAPEPTIPELIGLVATDAGRDPSARNVVNVSLQGNTGSEFDDPISRHQFEQNQMTFLADIAASLNALDDATLGRTVFVVSAGNGYWNRGGAGDGLDLAPSLQVLHRFYPRLFTSLDGAPHLLVVGGNLANGAKDLGFNHATANTNADPANPTDQSPLMVYAPGRDVEVSASGCREDGTSFAAPAVSNVILQALAANPTASLADIMRAFTRASTNNGHNLPTVAAVTAAITPPPGTHALAINVEGPGSVTRSAAGSNYPAGTTVTLTASPAAAFIGWAGAATGTAPVLTITMNADKTVTAVFGYRLTVAKAGTGTGIVSLDPVEPVYAVGTVVAVMAAADTGSRFTGWSGAATGSNPIQSVTMNADRTITATFTLDTANLLSGTWVGTRSATEAGVGTWNTAITWTLTQNGTQVTGTSNYRYTGVPSTSVDKVGDSGITSLTGTITGTSFTLTSAGGVRYVGTVSGNVISGNATGSDPITGGAQNGPFSLTRQ